MAKLTLKRLLKGPHRAMVEEVASLIGGPYRVEDAKGRVLLGDGPEDGPAHPVEVEGEARGVVRGEGGARIAAVVARLYEGELIKRALAHETLERYKELTLIYDLSDELSRVLDIREVASAVVQKAHAFLGCESAALYSLDGPKRWLTPIASVDPNGEVDRLPADEGLEGRVVAQGRAEIAEGEQTVMCAPLRSGEEVMGVLRCVKSGSGQWTAGDLKLLHALASNAAASMGHATLHHHQLQEQALRNQISRFVSPDLLEAVGQTDGAAPDAAVVFVDLGRAMRSVEIAAEDVVESLERASGAALGVLIGAGATVQLAQNEKLVAVFPHADGLGQSARDAVTAARTLRDTLVALGADVGIGVTHANVVRKGHARDFLGAVTEAAALQAEAMGRVLVDGDVAAALEGMDLQPVELSPELTAHEVRG